MRPILLNALAHEQTDLLIDAALTTGCWLILRGCPLRGAVLLGLSASFKGPTLLFLGYLLFRGRWRIVAAALAVTLGLNLIPDLIAQQWPCTYLLEWAHRIVLPAEDLQAPLGNWNATFYALANQSLGGTLQRLTDSIVVWKAGLPEFVAKAEPIGSHLMKAIAYSLMLLMAAISAWAARRGSRYQQDRSTAPDLPTRTAIESGSMMVLILMSSPMSALAHYGLLALPVLCFTRLAVVGRNRLAWLIMVVGIASALSVNKDLVGATAFYLAM